jgi:amino acid adenylation domain-containing protein
VHAGRNLSYREVNERANRIGRALLARGVGREDVVAVVSDRNPEWLAAVLAVLKAGACYLPVEPHFPAGRVTAMLSRAGCRLALTEHAADPGVAAEAAAGVPGLTVLGLDTVPDTGDGTDLGIQVGPDQLAYLYFTSGSTGEPKGALCEHAGLVNHLFAKAEDLGVGPGTVVAQTAPQCFDISLWQLLCAPVLGGRTVLVEQDVVLDAERFLTTLVTNRVNVVQVVPSYLDVVLSALERAPRELPDLRHVVVTGEEVRRELVRRWFDAQPGIGLVNAYGLTETSDDTNHEVMREVPDTARVPLGPVIPNARVSVVDENLTPVPLGAPGEIVFSGVCVGRGYVNDPERTRAAFTTDPHHPGMRLYRSGDQGRWLPDGKLEFLGRGDSQVKIRGFRIELGEIENRLLGLPGVRAAAAVVAERADGGRRLVAFHTDDTPHTPDELADGLPEYMVPAALHHREALPLTANGKVDKKELARQAALLGEGAGPPGSTSAPETAAQRRLAAAWAEVLRIPVEQIGRDDHFFDRGGTSLSAVRLALALDRVVSPKDLIQHPVLADLAELVESRIPEQEGQQ